MLIFPCSFSDQEAEGPTVPMGTITNGFRSLGYKGHVGGSMVEHLPSTQDVIPGSQDGVPHRAPCMEPAPPSACISASLSLMNNTNNKNSQLF